MDQFTEALLRAAAEAETLGCRMTRLRRAAEQHGGAETVREYLRRNRYSDEFDRLASLGRLDLTPEALAVQGRFGALFTDEEVNRCFERLCGAGYYFTGSGEAKK